VVKCGTAYSLVGNLDEIAGAFTGVECVIDENITGSDLYNEKGLISTKRSAGREGKYVSPRYWRCN
jgi:hypothetical protein